MPCLRAIFEYLVELMHSHYLMREWHLRIEELVIYTEHKGYMNRY